jgi:hypothetical protein
MHEHEKYGDSSRDAISVSHKGIKYENMALPTRGYHNRRMMSPSFPASNEGRSAGFRGGKNDANARRTG